MKRTLFLVGLLLMLGTCLMAASLDELLKKAAVSDGDVYLRIRSEITSQGKAIVPELLQKATDQKDPWQIHLVARICSEWIASSNRIEELRNKEWDNDREFHTNWNRCIIGPIGEMLPLAKKRMNEFGLFYYYIEINWKNTGELSRDRIFSDKRGPEAWCRFAREALREQPEFYYFVQATCDRLRQDAKFDNKANRDRYAFLKREKLVDAIPTLTELSESYSAATAFTRDGSKQVVGRHKAMLEEIMSFARAEDADVVEKEINKQQYLTELKPRVEILRKGHSAKEHSQSVKGSVSEPPFRLTHNP